MSCYYKPTFENIFGRPYEGIHSYRILGLAIVDVVLTILSAAILSYFWPTIGFLYALVILFLLGVIIHKVLCVDTALNQFIFG